MIETPIKEGIYFNWKLLYIEIDFINVSKVKITGVRKISSIHTQLNETIKVCKANLGKMCDWKFIIPENLQKLIKALYKNPEVMDVVSSSSGMISNSDKINWKLSKLNSRVTKSERSWVNSDPSAFVKRRNGIGLSISLQYKSSSGINWGGSSSIIKRHSSGNSPGNWSDRNWQGGGVGSLLSLWLWCGS